MTAADCSLARSNAKPTTKLTDIQKVERIFDPAMPPKMFPRSDTHSILNRIYRDDKNHESNTYLRFLLIDQYFPVPRARWNVTPGSVDEILTLPNYRSIDDYKESTQQLLNQIPIDDAKYASVPQGTQGPRAARSRTRWPTASNCISWPRRSRLADRLRPIRAIPERPTCALFGSSRP